MKKKFFCSRLVKSICITITLIPFILSTNTYYISDAKTAVTYKGFQSYKLHVGSVADDILEDPGIVAEAVKARKESDMDAWARKVIDLLTAKYKEEGLNLPREEILSTVVASFNRTNINYAEKEGHPIPDFDKLLATLEKELRSLQTSPEPGEGGSQLTWVTGPYTMTQLKDAGQATKKYLEQAGRENRIFDVRGNISKQVATYAARRTDPDRQLPYWAKGEMKSMPDGTKKYAADKQDKFIARLKAAKKFHEAAINSLEMRHLAAMKMAQYAPDAAREHDSMTRLAIVFDEDGNPSFYQDGKVTHPEFLAVTASSGGYRYEGFDKTAAYGEGRDARSIYLNLSNIEGYMNLAQKADKEAIYMDGRKLSGRDIVDAYLYKVFHEHFELDDKAAGHREETKAVKELITFVDKKIFEDWAKKRKDTARKERDTDKNKVVAEVTSANIAKFLKPEIDGKIDKKLIETAETELKRLVKEGLLVDFKVFANGGDIHIYTTSLNGNRKNDEALLARSIVETYGKILLKAKALNLLDNPENTIREFNELGFEEQIQTLEIRKTFKPLVFSERKAEPIAVISAANGYIGAFNLFIYEVLMNPAVNAGLTIDPQGDRGYVIEIWDSLENKTYTFDSITEHKEIRVLASLPGRYAIVGAYTKKEHKAGDAEPIIAVSVSRISDDRKRKVGNESPVLIIRSQSGLPAWGEIIEGFARQEPILTYGGEDTPYMLAMRPTEINEAATIGKSETGFRSILAGFGYQSYQKGEIGITGDIGGDKTLNLVRENADRWSKVFGEIPEELNLMKTIEPLKRPHVYDRDDKVTEARKRLDDRFADNPPKPTEAELAKGGRYEDSILYGKTQDLTISNIKADIGSVPGHYKPHPVLLQGCEDLLQIATRLGIPHAHAYVKWVKKYRMETLKEGIKTKKINGIEYAEELHKCAMEYIAAMDSPTPDKRFVIEIREAAGAVQTGVYNLKNYKVWHAGDDIQLTMFHDQEVEHPVIHQLAFEAFMYASDCAEFVGLYGRRQDLLVDKLVSGNIQGAGPGYAELQVKEGENVLLLSADKTAPGAFTNPFIAWIRKVIKQGKFKDGLIAEIWDINHSKRIFLDMTNEQDFKDAISLLSAPEEFAIKRVWTTKTKWDRLSDIKHVLSDTPIASASTERLVLTAGEYVGKDDPTMLIKISKDSFNEKDLIGLFEYPIMALGFMRGSHTGPLMPDVQKEALPHKFDGPPPLTGFIIDGIRKDGLAVSFKDAFKKSNALTIIQEKINFIAEVLRRQGWAPPHRVDGPDTEYTTFPKVMAALVAKGRAKKASNEAQTPFDKAIREEPVRTAINGYQSNIAALLDKKCTIWIETSILSGSELIEERKFLSIFTKGKTNIRAVDSIKDIPTSGEHAFNPQQDVVVPSQASIDRLSKADRIPEFLATAYMMPPVEVGDKTHPYIREILIGARLLPEIKKSDIPEEGQLSASKPYNTLRKILAFLTNTKVTPEAITALLPNPNIPPRERLRRILQMIVRYLPLTKYDRNQIEHIRKFLWSA